MASVTTTHKHCVNQNGWGIDAYVEGGKVRARGEGRYMNDRRREAEVRGAHLESVLKRAVVPEFPSGSRLVLIMADHTGAGFASTMPDPVTLEIVDHVARHLLDADEDDEDEDDEDEDEGVVRDVLSPFDVGDLVKPCPECGHSLPFPRDHAVVICTEPFTLVSEDANWVAQTDPADLHLIYAGSVDPWTLKKCLTHLPEKPL